MCRYAPEYNLEQTGETYAQRAVATDRYRFWRAHAAPAPSALSRGRISLAVLAGCASKGQRARGRHGRRAAKPPRRPSLAAATSSSRATRSTRSRVRTTSTSRTSSAGTTSAIPTRFPWARCSLSGGGAAPAARRRSRRWRLPSRPRRSRARLTSRPTAAPRPRRHRPPRPPWRPRRPKTGARGRCRRHQLGWPATGQITQGFNNNTKGIDIAGNLGDPVIAAADGKVMYSGNACAAWAT